LINLKEIRNSFRFFTLIATIIMVEHRPLYS